jgi:hypothetical protein
MPNGNKNAQSPQSARAPFFPRPRLPCAPNARNSFSRSTLRRAHTHLCSWYVSSCYSCATVWIVSRGCHSFLVSFFGILQGCLHLWCVVVSTLARSNLYYFNWFIVLPTIRYADRTLFFRFCAKTTPLSLHVAVVVLIYGRAPYLRNVYCITTCTQFLLWISQW